MRKVLFVLFAALFGTLIAPTMSSAAEVSVANCNGYTLHSASHVTRNGAAVGAVQLCRDGDRWFAIFISYRTMPSGHWANAYLDHYVNGVYSGATWSCDADGGNDHVIPGQTWCVTPKIFSNSASVSFKAYAFEYYDPTGGWDIYAAGFTQRCNKYVGCTP
jgi:hypothetical protein